MQHLLEQKVIEFIKGHLHDDPFSLSLKLKAGSVDHLQDVILQIQARQKALAKLPGFAENYDIVFPPPISVEQASSAPTARFKAELFKGESIADLTGGMGVDTLFFAAHFRTATYVEKDPELCEIARHNFSVLHSDEIKIVNATAEEFSKNSPEVFDLIYLDPSRRDQSQRVFKISDCKPDVLALESQLVRKGRRVLVKLSPLADIQNAFSSFRYLQKVWVVSYKNECKELLCLLSSEGANEQAIESVNILANDEREIFAFDWNEEKAAMADTGMPAQYIYEPNSSLLKAGAFKLVGERFALKKLHTHTHLYTSDSIVDFQGRVFFLKDVLKADRKVLDRAVSGRKVNVICRNFYMNPEEIYKKFKLKKGDDAYLIATTLADGSKAFLACDRIK